MKLNECSSHLVSTMSFCIIRFVEFGKTVKINKRAILLKTKTKKQKGRNQALVTLNTSEVTPVM